MAHCADGRDRAPNPGRRRRAADRRPRNGVPRARGLDRHQRRRWDRRDRGRPCRRSGRRHPRRDAAGGRRRRGLPPDPRVLECLHRDAHRERRGDRPDHGAHGRRGRLPREAVLAAGTRRTHQGPPAAPASPHRWSERATWRARPRRRQAHGPGRRPAGRPHGPRVQPAGHPRPASRDRHRTPGAARPTVGAWVLGGRSPRRRPRRQPATQARRRPSAPRFVETVRGVGYRLREAT